MVGPLQILSAISAVGSIADGVGKVASSAANAIAGNQQSSNSSAEADFGALLNNNIAQNDGSSKAEANSIIAMLGNSTLSTIQANNTAANGGLFGITSVGAEGSLTQNLEANVNINANNVLNTANIAKGGEAPISEDTINILNDILAGKDPADISLYEGAENGKAAIDGEAQNTELTGQLNKNTNNTQTAEQTAAQNTSTSNGTIAASAVAPAVAVQPAVAVDPTTITTDIDANAAVTDNAGAAAQKAVTAENTSAKVMLTANDKKALEIGADKTNGDAAQNLQNKVLTKDILESSLSQTGNLHADKAISKNAFDINGNPNSAIFAHDIKAGAADVIKLNGAREDIQGKMGEIDTYKVVNVSKKDNILDVKLEPGNLGKVHIKLDFAADGKANISVIADKQGTLDMLKSDSKEIQKILADNGVKTDSGSMSFNLNQQNKNNQQSGDFNFFSGKALSFRVEQEISQMAMNNNFVEANYNAYGTNAANGMLNIMV